jgi:membrane protease YdiL (CAAX protease family)
LFLFYIHLSTSHLVNHPGEKEKNMNTVTSFVKRYPQPIFWLIAWSTFAFGWFMNAKNPSMIWGFFIWGPFLGGLLVTAIADGRSGVKTYFSRMVRWRVGFKWYLIALFVPLVLRLAAAGLNLLSGAKLSADIQFPPFGDLIFEFIIFNFFFIAIGEEPGFRGFALPRLLVGRSAVAASLILGVLHAIWHIPLFVTGDSQPIPAILIIVSGALLFTWIFNNTKGSVLIAMLLHLSVDFWVPIFNPLFSGADALRQEYWLGFVFVVMAVSLRLLFGKELGRKTEPAPERIAADPAMAAK